VPALPGANQIFSILGSREKDQPKACSRPPLPTIKTVLFFAMKVPLFPKDPTWGSPLSTSRLEPSIGFIF
jgi:hypothetical protein